ncbi:MAG: hypothetical protein P4L41_15615 [Flavipsychrobacter sp.]|nr:hypothetical protein [Flavipsychrobacter sp.]
MVVSSNVGQNLLKTAMDCLKVSARACAPTLKISRTIADLADSEDIRPEHLAEAIQFRSLDRGGWVSIFASEKRLLICWAQD